MDESTPTDVVGTVHQTVHPITLSDDFAQPAIDTSKILMTRPSPSSALGILFTPPPDGRRRWG